MPKGSPIYTKVDPETGAITNEFSGRILADGLTIRPDTQSGAVIGTPDRERTIRWEEEDGALVAQFYSVDQSYSTRDLPPEDVRSLTEHNQEFYRPVNPLLKSWLRHTLTGQWRDNGVDELINHSAVRVGARGAGGNQERLLIDSDQHSDFVQTLPRPREIIDIGPFAFVAGGGIADGAEGPVVFNHNILATYGLVAANYTIRVLGELTDELALASWSHRCQWRADSRADNSIRIVFFNLRGAGVTVRPGFYFYLRYSR